MAEKHDPRPQRAKRQLLHVSTNRELQLVGGDEVHDEAQDWAIVGGPGFLCDAEEPVDYKAASSSQQL
jgi:hypothetical protein